jgi:hypothetical protein
MSRWSARLTCSWSTYWTQGRRLPLARGPKCGRPGCSGVRCLAKAHVTAEGTQEDLVKGEPGVAQMPSCSCQPGDLAPWRGPSFARIKPTIGPIALAFGAHALGGVPFTASAAYDRGQLVAAPVPPAPPLRRSRQDPRPRPPGSPAPAGRPRRSRVWPPPGRQGGQGGRGDTSPRALPRLRRPTRSPVSQFASACGGGGVGAAGGRPRSSRPARRGRRAAGRSRGQVGALPRAQRGRRAARHVARAASSIRA